MTSLLRTCLGAGGVAVGILMIMCGLALMVIWLMAILGATFPLNPGLVFLSMLVCGTIGIAIIIAGEHVIWKSRWYFRSPEEPRRIRASR